jgi:hypothetical protein
MTGSVIIHLIFCKMFIGPFGLTGIVYSMNFSNFIMLFSVILFIYKKPEQWKLMIRIPFE